MSICNDTLNLFHIEAFNSHRTHNSVILVIVPYKRREIRLLNPGRQRESLFFIIQSVDTGKHTKQARAAVNEFIVGILCTLGCYINTNKRLSYLLQNLFFHNF